ncbi:MAG: aromatic amino acid lyase, partial [Desulfobacterales bacterium]|nr:aromatic amino acid lyase [Desulfobacterales bacterium]
LVAIARGGAPVRFTTEAHGRLQKSSDLISKWVAEEKKVYGVTTGFGNLADVSISRADARQLQKNLLMSHAAGVGRPLDSEAVRAVMALRVKDLVRGNSGARPQTVQLLVDMLNAGITPVVPEKGSVGASGDLCPLAHLALVLIGLGEAHVNGERMNGAQALERCNLLPVDLESGEGLALINGTQVMTGVGGLAVYDALKLGKLIDIAAAISLEVLMGSRTEFDPRIHELRPHPGQARVAANMLRITQNSDIVTSHKDCSRVQDAYTLRCSPQVHGASHDAVRHARGVVETEMNSSTGNPLVFNDTETFLTGGNFHGQPVALAMDFMCMAVAELANISERRIERLVNPK